MTTCAKLTGLRQILQSRGLDAYLVANADPHGSECVAKRYCKREALTGFTGSAGVALVTRKSAFLWTDGRYTTQASQQLKNTPWNVRIQKLPGALGIVKEIIAWVEANLQEVCNTDSTERCKLAIDAAVTSLAEAKALQSSKMIDLVPLEESLIKDSETIENTAEPTKVPTIFPLSPAMTGKTVTAKLQQFVAELEDAALTGFVLNNLDDIAWLLNLRGKGDVPNAGVFQAYALLLCDSAHGDAREWTLHVFSDIPKIVRSSKNSPLSDHFPNLQVKEGLRITSTLSENIGIHFHEYFDFFRWIRTHLPTVSSERPLAYSSELNFAVCTCLRELPAVTAPESLVCLPSPVTYHRNRKNAAEIDGIRQCHISDAAAVVQYLHWLQTITFEGKAVTECEGADALLNFRKEIPEFCQPSFDTISSTGPNSAIIHYGPKPETCAVIQPNEIYLVDSGAHYTTGTTDITRTVFIGDDKPTEAQRKVYTNVLKGLVNVHRTRFPATQAQCASGFLDAIARRALWESGMDYPHSTGHGVGHGLSVHEGPMGIRKFIASSGVPKDVPTRLHKFYTKFSDRSFAPGVVLSNEPGCYIAGKFGVRIENIVSVHSVTVEPLVEPDEPLENEEKVKWYALENFTLVPFCRKLMDVTMLTYEEKAWVNTYYEQIRGVVGKALQAKGAIAAAEWLEKECQPIL